MAIAVVQKRVLGQTTVSAVLLDGVTGTDEGEYINVEGVEYYSTDVKGISGDTVNIWASSSVTKPTDADEERQLGSDITADGRQEYADPIRWIKARCSVYSAGTITITFLGRIGKS